MKIAFIGWNPFQFIHFYRFFSIDWKNCTIIVEKRNFFDLNKLFIEKYFKNLKIVFVHNHDNLMLDGQYDIIIAQTYFKCLENFKYSKIVFLQYGYAKETYNFGQWRALSHLVLCYGNYAHLKFNAIVPALVIGHPRAEDWTSAEFHRKAQEKYHKKLDNSKKTLLFAPTWGNEETIYFYYEKIIALTKNFNLILKWHHNSSIFKKIKREIAPEPVIFADEYDDLFELLVISDGLISDYSGAIFDGFYCKKPLFFIDFPAQFKAIEIDNTSLEVTHRELLGLNLSQIVNWAQAIELALQKDYDENQLAFHRNLFADDADKPSISEIFHDLHHNKFLKTVEQQAIEEDIKCIYRSKNARFSFKKNFNRFFMKC